jgi:hypothetical protein
MSWILACLTIVAAWWILSRALAYQRLFAVPHLIQFGQALPGMKRAAMRNVFPGGPPPAPSPDDGRVLRTSAGLVFVYTVSIDDAGKYVHHASASIPGRVTAHAVGETFILLWARLLCVPFERLVLQMSPATVHHAEFVLNESEQSAFARRPVETPTVELLKAFHAECLKARLDLRQTVAAGERP